MTDTATPEQWIRTASDRQAIAEGCYFDQGGADRARTFMDKFIRLPDESNPTRTVPFRLMPWQWDRFVAPLFGWKRPDGSRRFRFAWIEVAKKNGKSTLAAGIILTLLVADGEADCEIYGAAKTREQATIIYRAAEAMVKRSPHLRKAIDIRAHVKRLINPRLNGFYAVIPNEPDAIDGINAHGIVFDEIHRQTRRDLYDALQYAGAARRQPVQVIITTAGADRESIGYELHERAVKIIEGSIIDTETLAYIAAADPADDPGDPATWAKANPSLGVTIDRAELAAEYERAKDSPARLQNFKRLRLNMWVSQASRWLDYDRWMACPARQPIEQLTGRDAYAGLDLSSQHDITALVLQIPSEGTDGRTYHDVLPFFFLPEANIADAERRAGVPYRAWSDAGLIELTPGDWIDYAYVRKRANELREQFNILEIAYDPTYSGQIAQQLIDDGFKVFPFYQRRTMTNPVLRYLESATIEGRMRHGNHPIMNWMVGNAEVDVNVDGLMKAAKPKGAAKIDGITALAMSLGHHCKQSEPITEYQEAPVIILG